MIFIHIKQIDYFYKLDNFLEFKVDKTSLESFILIAEYHSFSRAAEKLHITQPAISKRIANLESQLNTSLLVRNNKDVQLTQSGHIFLQHARKLIEAMNDCQTAVRNIQPTVAGNLKIGISHHIGLHRLPEFLKSFTDTFPEVHLQIRFITSEEATTLIQGDELEIALTTLPQEAPAKIHMQNLWPDPLHIVVAGNHPLAQQQSGTRLSLQTLSQYPAILPSFNTYTGQLIQQLFSEQKLTINHYIETNNLETIRMMTSIGLGWTALPRTMLNNQLQSLILTQDIRLPCRNLGYLHHHARILSSAASAFIQTLQNHSATNRKIHATFT